MDFVYSSITCFLSIISDLILVSSSSTFIVVDLITLSQSTHLSNFIMVFFGVVSVISIFFLISFSRSYNCSSSYSCFCKSLYLNNKTEPDVNSTVLCNLSY